MIALVRAGRRPDEPSKQFEANAQTIRNWVQQADRDDGLRQDGLTSAEREELRRLHREKRQLRLEREILAKATARVSHGRPVRSQRRIRIREGESAHRRRLVACYARI
jgi:transposase